MQKSDQINELATALSVAQGEMKGVDFNAVNPFLKNKYADLGALIESAKPILAKNGLSVSQLPFGESAKVGVTTILLHTSGQWMSTDVSLLISDEKGKSGAQVAGSIITYLRRYSLSSILGMYSEEDDDGATAGKATAPAKQTAPKAQAKTPALASNGQKVALLKLYRELHPDLTEEECNTDLQTVLQTKFGHPPEQTTSAEMGMLWNEMNKTKTAK